MQNIVLKKTDLPPQPETLLQQLRFIPLVENKIPTGVFITTITENSFWEKTGLVQNDIITKFNDEPTTDLHGFLEAVISLYKTKTANILIKRDHNNTLNIKVTFEE